MTNSTVDLFVPATMYIRPNGKKEEGDIIVTKAATPERGQILDVLEYCGIKFTVEEIGLGVAICMDDGEFDYKIQIVPSPKVPETVMKMVDAFDYADYVKSRALHDKMETEAANESRLMLNDE